MSIERVMRKSGPVWRVRWRDADGRPRSRVVGSRRDAVIYDAELVRARRLGQLAAADQGRETLGAFAERWWQDYAVPNLAESTQSSYAALWDKHIEPHLGHLRLCDLRPGTVEAFRAELSRNGVGDDTVRRALVLLQGVLRRAVEWELLPRNPVTGTRKPPQRRSRTPQLFTPSAIELMRARLMRQGDLQSAALISVLAYAGLRPGEALALTWQDVRAQTLLVSKAVSLGRLGHIKEPKNGAIRAVRLLQPLADDLRFYRESRQVDEQRSLLFPSPEAQLWTRSRWANWRKRTFIPAAVAVGIEGSRPYDLRHSFVSLLIEDGRTVVDVAAQAGHSPTMCISTYAHLFAEGSIGDGTVEERITSARAAAARILDDPEAYGLVSVKCLSEHGTAPHGPKESELSRP